MLLRIPPLHLRIADDESNRSFSVLALADERAYGRKSIPYGILQLRRNSFSRGEIRVVNGSKEGSLSPWDEKPYELLPGGKKAYLDEQDIVTFLDPPKELIPLEPASYNPAVYLW